MKWIRNPVWDATWILSGVPIGIGLAVWRPPIMLVVAVFAAINTAHLISPIVLAWTHRTFRWVAFVRWGRFIAVPIVVMLTAILVGFSAVGPIQVNAATMEIRVADYHHDWPLLGWIGLYFVWNAYHFGAQNFGILRLYGVRDRKVVIKRLTVPILKWVCVALTVLGFIVIPHAVKDFMPAGSFLRLYVPIFILGVFSFSHSLAAIGVSAPVWGNHSKRSPWIFVVAVFAASAPLAWLLAHNTIIIHSFRLMVLLITTRIGLGFVHFLYDRWIYKFSDPQVRATIGRELLAAS
jgi:hypothetical protein